MKQLLLQNDRVALVRVPRVLVEPGSVLVQTYYSLVSTGTELAGIKAQLAEKERSSMDKASDISSKAVQYLGKAINDPAKAAQRLRQIAADRVRKLSRLASKPVTVASAKVTDLGWGDAGAGTLTVRDSGFLLQSDDTEAGYQLVSRRIDLGELSIADKQDDTDREVQFVLRVSMRGKVESAPYTLGLLNADQSAWIGQTNISIGEIDEELQFACLNSDSVYLVLANGGVGNGSAEFDEFQVSLEAAEDDGLPVSELADAGWGIGYSLAGEVIAIGTGVTRFKVGDLVACGGAGQANHAEFVTVKQNLVVKVPDGVQLKHAATTTVGSIAMQGVRRTDARLSEVICLVGLGLIGLMVAQMFRAAGCKVVGLDLDEQRVQRAHALGITAAYANFDECLNAVQHLTEGHGADATVITAAAPSSNHAIINNAMKTTRRRGKVVIVGDVGLHAERAEFYRKEIDLLMSTSYGPGRYDSSYEVFGQDYPYAYVRWTQNRNMASYLELVASGAIDVAALIDLVVPIDAATEAYESLAKSERPPLGVVIEYSPQPFSGNDRTEDSRESTTINIRGARKQRGNKVGYALIGAGGFGTSMLVPQMDKRADVFQLKSICSRDPVRGGNFARQRSVAQLTTDFETVLNDDAVELVVIATRHDEHAEQVVRALGAGKHVFVEKPLALTWAELDRVTAAYQQAESQILTIGFNRSFAPATQAIATHFAERQSPMMINYRLNGGFIPGDSWIQDQRGGGRNLGEACHMYDLFASLTGAAVSGIAATSIDVHDTAYFNNDNFVATINFADGSVGNLLYTAAGPKTGMGKERIEVFCEGQSMVIDDFIRCTHFPANNVVWENAVPDKGHEKEFDLLADALLNGNTSNLIPFSRIVETTAVSLHVEDKLRGIS